MQVRLFISAITLLLPCLSAAEPNCKANFVTDETAIVQVGSRAIAIVGRAPQNQRIVQTLLLELEKAASNLKKRSDCKQAIQSVDSALDSLHSQVTSSKELQSSLDSLAQAMTIQAIGVEMNPMEYFQRLEQNVNNRIVFAKLSKCGPNIKQALSDAHTAIDGPEFEFVQARGDNVLMIPLYGDGPNSNETLAKKIVTQQTNIVVPVNDDQVHDLAGMIVRQCLAQ
jgi:hypothetical protein